tara:strand:- start:428 stop:922 length:495 start_codon:yes stop_codon:yes gene_type:complete
MNKFFIFSVYIFCYQNVCHAEAFSIDCLKNYQNLLSKNVNLHIDPKLKNGPSWILNKPLGYIGKVPNNCLKDFGSGGNLRIITDNGELFFIEILFNSIKPVMIKHIEPNQVSIMEKSFLKNNFALANFDIKFNDDYLNFSYFIKKNNNSFSEKLHYLSKEVPIE